MFPFSDHASATDLARQLARGQVSAQTIAERAFERCQEPKHASVFITLTAERALKEARQSDERRAQNRSLGPWDGIPIAWKDLFDFAGHVTTAGSKTILQNAPATKDAAVVAACAKQGTVSLGKTNLSEFAYSGLGLNPHFGTPVNPFSGTNPRSPGGSSSGSAVAVAEGIVPVAVGTDTAGSIRVPASFCGLYGFKASTSRYSKEGCFPLSTSLDSFGGFAHCVEDLIQLDALMRNREIEPVPTFPSLSDCTFVIPQNVVFDEVDPQVHSAFEAFVERLVTSGAIVRQENFPIFDEVQGLFENHGTLTVAEAATVHEELLASDQADLMDPRVLARLLTSSYYTVADYIKLQWARQKLSDDVRTSLDGGILLFPTVPILPPVIADLEASSDVFAATNLTVLRNTMIGSYLDLPGVTVPIGFSHEGLPIGALISAPTGHDDRILALCRSLELAFSD